MKTQEIQRIACLGTGVIGASWCTNFVMKGYEAVLYDISDEQLASGRQKVADNLAFLVEKACMTREAAGQALDRVPLYYLHGGGPLRCAAGAGVGA